MYASQKHKHYHSSQADRRKKNPNTLCASNNRMNFSFRATANLSPITLCIKIKQDSRAGPIPKKHLAFQLARLITAALIDVSTYINDGSNDCCYETGTAWRREPTKKTSPHKFFLLYTRLQLLSDAQTLLSPGENTECAALDSDIYLQKSYNIHAKTKCKLCSVSADFQYVSMTSEGPTNNQQNLSCMFETVQPKTKKKMISFLHSLTLTNNQTAGLCEKPHSSILAYVSPFQ